MILAMILTMMLLMMLTMSFITSPPLIVMCSIRNNLEFVWIVSMIFFHLVDGI